MASDKTYPMRVRPLEAEVNSRTRPGVKHKVRGASCDCEDFTYNVRKQCPFCAHIVAFYLEAMGFDQDTIDRLAPLVKDALKALAGGSDVPAVAEVVLTVLSGGKAA